MARRLALALVVACTPSTPPPMVVTGEVHARAVDPDAIRRACAMEVSCFAMPPIATGGACAAQFESGLALGLGIFFGPSADDLERYIACANSAPDCASALACASQNHGPAYCESHPPASCDGDLAVRCQGDWGVELVDCAASGLHCAQANNSAICTNGRACSDGTADRCDGNHAVHCNTFADLETVTDCGAFDESCTAGSCTATNAINSCSGSDGCVNADGRWCLNGLEQELACSTYASHCELAPSSSIPVTCVPDATDCTATTPDTCNGDALRMCVDGVFVDTPCTSIGLATCQVTTSGAVCR